MTYYVVRDAYRIGIFDDHNECQEATRNHPEKSVGFTTRDEAEAFMGSWGTKAINDNADGFLVAVISGSHSTEINKYSYGIQLILPNGELRGLKDIPADQEYFESEDITGDVFGTIDALEWASENGYEKVKIYYAYDGLEKWLTGVYKARSEIGKMYQKKFTNYQLHLEIDFVHVPVGDRFLYYEKAYELAREALNLK